MDDFSSMGSSTRQDLSFCPTGQVSPALPHRMERDDSQPASGASTQDASNRHHTPPGICIFLVYRIPYTPFSFHEKNCGDKLKVEWFEIVVLVS